MIKQLKINWLLIIVILAAVVRFPVGVELRAGLELNVRLAIILILAIWICSNVNLWAGLFLILSVFSSIVPWFVLTGFKELQTIPSYLALDWVVLGCLLLSLISKGDIPDNNIYVVLGIIAVLNIGFLFCQRIGVDPYTIFGMKGGYSPVGMMTNRNEVSATIALCGPVFFKKKAFLFFIPMLLAGLYLSKSLNGMVGFLSILIILFMFKFNGDFKGLFFILVLSVGCGLIYYDIIYGGGESFRARLYIWKRSISIMWQNQPFLGFGLGNWSLINSYAVKNDAYNTAASWTRVHNSFIHAYIEMGIGFIVILFGYFAQIIKNIKFSIPVLALGPIIVCCSTNSLFRMNAINGMIVIIWLALLNRRINGSSV